MAEVRPEIETFPKIKVVGVGGSGGSAINRMIASKIKGVEFIAMNTDVQALHYSQAQQKLHIGKTLTRGLGAGMDPEVGGLAADESQNEIRELLKGADMVFVTCGLGGGTGTGAGPKVAEIAKELGALTVAVVTRPFMFEGAQRRALAEQGYDRFAEVVDTIITIPNDRVLQIIDRKCSMRDAFEIVDDVLRQAVQGIASVVTQYGEVNVDFADVKAVMSNRGSAIMGIGRGSGENRTVEAAKMAISSPLLEISIDGAKAILFTVTGGSNLGLFELSEAAKIITQNADPNAKVIFGAIIDETMKDEVKLTVVATGFETRPAPRKTIASGMYQPNRQPETVEPMSFARPATQQRAPEPVQQQVARQVEPLMMPVPKPASRMPEPAPAAEQPHFSKPVYTPAQSTAPKADSISSPSLPSAVVSRVPAATEEDEIAIPAWLRKKML